MSNTQGLRFHDVACLSLSAALAVLSCLSGPAVGDEVKGVRSGQSVSFQRDGMITDIYMSRWAISSGRETSCLISAPRRKRW